MKLKKLRITNINNPQYETPKIPAKGKKAGPDPAETKLKSKINALEKQNSALSARVLELEVKNKELHIMNAELLREKSPFGGPSTGYDEWTNSAIVQSNIPL